MTLAQEKFKAAQVLVEQNLMSGAVEVLLSALLTAAADRAGLDAPVTPQDAGVWLYGEALPRELLTRQEADLITRGISLSQCPSVPENLTADLLRDTDAFLHAEIRE